jgi:hypothetical protein
MADSSAFGNFFSSMTGMGNPMTQNKNEFQDYEKEILNKMDPTLAGAFILSSQRQKMQEDPNRLREQLQVYKELRAEEATNAARIQADREKRQFQYQLAASIPNTINQIGQNIAQATLNPLRLQILADTPGKITQAYGALPRINIPDFR